MAGYGQIGYCKVCASDLKAEINKRLRRRETYPAIMAWAATKDFSISKPTLISHKKHITDPKTTFVEAARKSPELKRVTNTEFLEAVIAKANQRIESDPDAVTIDHGLRAAQVLESRKDRTGDALNVLVLALMGRRKEPDMIEGEYIELPALPASEEEPVAPSS